MSMKLILNPIILLLMPSMLIGSKKSDTQKPPVEKLRRMAVLGDYMDKSKNPELNPQQLKWTRLLLRAEFARLKAEQQELHRKGTLMILARIRLNIIGTLKQKLSALEREKIDARATQQFLSSELAKVQGERTALRRQVAQLNMAFTNEKEENEQRAVDLARANNRVKSLYAIIDAKDARIGIHEAREAHLKEHNRILSDAIRMNAAEIKSLREAQEVSCLHQ